MSALTYAAEHLAEVADSTAREVSRLPRVAAHVLCAKEGPRVDEVIQ